METNLTTGKTEKTAVYGRNYEEDMDLFYNDITLRQILALYDKFDCIHNAKHLSDIMSFEESEASSKLEALRNIGLLELSKNGYIKTKPDNYYYLDSYSDKTKRASKHSVKLLQIAAQIAKGPQFTDHSAVFATTLDLIKEFDQTVFEAFNNLKEKTNKVSKDEKNKLFTYASAYFATNISEDVEGN